MARHALMVRELVGEIYVLETTEGPLHGLFETFKRDLLHDLDPDAFADMVAQTVAYGLLSAATQSKAPDRLKQHFERLKRQAGQLLTEIAADSH